VFIYVHLLDISGGILMMIRRQGLARVLVLFALAAAFYLPPGADAAPPAQQQLLFDQEFPASVMLSDATPQLAFAFPCTERKVASVYAETVAGDLAIEVTVLAPNGSPFAYGTTVSSEPNITVAEAFIIPATGQCTLNLSRVGNTSGRAELRLLSGYARLTRWDAFDGVTSPLRMAWEPYASENMEVDVSPDGRLRIHIIKDNLIGHASPEDADLVLDDMYIQADFVIDGAPSYAEYGFVVRSDSEGDNFYTITVSSEGDYSVYFYNGEWNVVQDWTVSSLIDTADKQPRIGLWVQDNVFRLYANDRLVAEVSDSTRYASSGILGLAAATGVDQFDTLTVYVDNVVITTPFQGATTAALPFGGNDAKPTPSSGLTGLFDATKPPVVPTLAPVVPTKPPTQPPPPPTPRPTATTEPVQGLVLNNWASSQPSDILAELQSYGLAPTGGSMKINVPSSYGDTSSSGFSFYPLGRGQTFRNFLLLFDARLVDTGPGSGCGMYFRNSNTASNTAMIMEDGYALLGDWDSAGSLTDASFYDASTAVIPGKGATNRVIVLALESSVLMYVNGELLTVGEFTPRTGGLALEMYVASDDFGQTVRTYCQLNNIWLWEF
jgi:hypothetical protein